MTVMEDSVHCDWHGCLTTLAVLDSGTNFPQVTIESIRDHADKAGWLVDAGGHDFCPPHSPQRR